MIEALLAHEKINGEQCAEIERLKNMVVNQSEKTESQMQPSKIYGPVSIETVERKNMKRIHYPIVSNQTPDGRATTPEVI